MSKLSMVVPTPPETELCCPADDDLVVETELPVDGPDADAALASLAKALGHPTRVRILRMLARREARRCSQIVDEFPAAQSTVSEHLRVLRAVGLIVAREDGPSVGYCIAPGALARLKALVAAL